MTKLKQPLHENEKKIGNRQILIGLVVLGAFILAFMFFDALTSPEQHVGFTQDATLEENVLATLTRGARPEMSWVRESENRLSRINERLEALETENSRMAEALAGAEQDKAEAFRVIDTQAAEIERLTGSPGYEQDFSGQDFTYAADDPFQLVAPLPPLSSEVGQDFVPDQEVPPEAITAAPLLVNFDLEEKANSAVKSTKEYLPAGAYAPALVISGADASVGLQSQSDPRPVLLRITDVARSAARDGVVEEIDIKGCTVTAEAVGDLSSEKVYVRPQTLTCSRKTGEVIETPVYGYVAGSGKAGVRGPVISREGDLIEKALLAGFVQGIGQGASQVFQPQDLALAGGQVLGQTSTARRVKDVGLNALGTGVSSAANTVSQYLIDRAEQYQPVISLASATPVEIVFLRGTYLDGEEPIDEAVQTTQATP